MHTDARTTYTDIPLADAVNGPAPSDPPQAVTISTESSNGRNESGRFVKGYPGGPGRPRKGESLPELLTREYEKQKRKLVSAAVKRALREDQVGNRAFNDGLDRVYGKVADEMHITTTDSPLLAFLTRHNDRPYVEAEFTATDITPAQVRSPDTGESDTVHK